MAILHTKQLIVDDAYKFVFCLEQVSEADAILIAKYGEPTVDFGGTFDNGLGVSYTLPDQYFNIVSGFPVTITVDPTVAPFNTNTTTALALYASTMQTRVTGAFTTLRANTDTFSGETLTNI